MNCGLPKEDRMICGGELLFCFQITTVQNELTTQGRQNNLVWCCELVLKCFQITTVQSEQLLPKEDRIIWSGVILLSDNNSSE